MRDLLLGERLFVVSVPVSCRPSACLMVIAAPFRTAY